VVGEQGSGKTSFCRALIVAVHTVRPVIRIAGVVSPGLFEKGVKVAIEAEAVASGEHRLLARLRLPGEAVGEVATPRWLFDPEALAWGDEVLARAVPCDLLVVDEMGPLEFEMGQGWQAGMAAVDSGSFEVALVTMRPGLVAEALGRWPGAELVRVTGREQAVEAAEEMALQLL
jgi:nucleoside-triphosphatase THEP1